MLMSHHKNSKKFHRTILGHITFVSETFQQYDSVLLFETEPVGPTDPLTESFVLTRTKTQSPRPTPLVSSPVSGPNIGVGLLSPLLRLGHHALGNGVTTLFSFGTTFPKGKGLKRQKHKMTTYTRNIIVYIVQYKSNEHQISLSLNPLNHGLSLLIKVSFMGLGQFLQ